MQGIEKLTQDLKRKTSQISILKKKIPRYVAAAAEKMKDANFSAEGFIEGGSVKSKWPKRKKETARSSGKRILHSTGILQNSVKAKALAQRVHVGVDLSKVPYAKVHNKGEEIHQEIKAHVRTHPRTGKTYSVGPFTRKVTFPRRKYLGYSPDIFKIADKDIKKEIDRIFK